MSVTTKTAGRNHGGAETRHALKDRKDDLYETPDLAVHALLRHETTLGQHVWEPACGPGAIVRILRQAGKTVTATDLVNYDCPDSEAGVDFLMEARAPNGVQSIVTNPPFKLADEFIRHGLTLVPTVCMLLRLAYLEGACRLDLHQRHLERVWIGAERLPQMHRHGWEGPKQSNSGRAFAWFVFKRQTTPGPASIHHISWRASDA